MLLKNTFTLIYNNMINFTRNLCFYVCFKISLLSSSLKIKLPFFYTSFISILHSIIIYINTFKSINKPDFYYCSINYTKYTALISI